ncbi:MAG: CidA/LrgA family protein [Candidatus Puniceispirillaceae bacterium]
MLAGIFTIFMFQLVGEAIQKYFGLAIPGPVIGLVLMLIALLASKHRTHRPIAGLRDNLITVAETLLGHLSLLFVPIGVGVILHLHLLETQLLRVLGVIIFGTISTMIFTAFIFSAFGSTEND